MNSVRLYMNVGDLELTKMLLGNHFKNGYISYAIDLNNVPVLVFDSIGISQEQVCSFCAEPNIEIQTVLYL